MVKGTDNTLIGLPVKRMWHSQDDSWMRTPAGKHLGLFIFLNNIETFLNRLRTNKWFQLLSFITFLMVSSKAQVSDWAFLFSFFYKPWPIFSWPGSHEQFESKDYHNIKTDGLQLGVHPQTKNGQGWWRYCSTSSNLHGCSNPHLP